MPEEQRTPRGRTQRVPIVRERAKVTRRARATAVVRVRKQVERRTEIINEECRLTPRLQAVVAGTTVNVRNDDRLAHTTRFVLGGAGGDTLARVPLTDDGQVVPNEHIAAKSGLVAATCAQHPWTRGYIAVFESPYFALTDGSGGFRLDSIPPGTYHLRVWHERGTSTIERDVTVSATGISRVQVKVRLR